MFLLTPQDVDIVNVQHPKQPKKIPILSYQERTFRLLSVYPSMQSDEAHAAWRDLTDNEGKACVLLEEPHRFSLWGLINIDKKLLEATTPTAYSKACVLMIQSMYGDVEQLLGTNQAKKFGAALDLNAQKQIREAGGLGVVLRVDPLAEAGPTWEEDDISAVLLAMHRLGCKFFGRSKFVRRTLGSLNTLPDNDRVTFISWLRMSLLAELWLEPEVIS